MTIEFKFGKQTSITKLSSLVHIFKFLKQSSADLKVKVHKLGADFRQHRIGHLSTFFRLQRVYQTFKIQRLLYLLVY